MSEEIPYGPEDEVLVFRLFRRDPDCIEYAYAVESSFERTDPKHLEQLHVVHQILDKAIEDAEGAILNKVCETDRKVRKARRIAFDEALDKITDGPVN